MALREKFGRLVLLEETDASGLGLEYRAARLGPAGLERLVSVLRFTPEISSHEAATRRLMEDARQVARLSSPGLVRVLGLGRVDQSFYISTELVEGRTLAAVLARCARESFPFAVDHALMVASRAAAALEYLHGKKDEAGKPFVHGLLAPSRLVVCFDGEVKIKGLGLWAALHEASLVPKGEAAWLAPEQAQGAGDARSDVYSLALCLLQALLPEPLAGHDPLEALASARVVALSGEPEAPPAPLRDLLARSLARDPAARFRGAAEMRKAIDALLFSGDFTPTTFDLAFFMHTLYREELDAETRAVEQARAADYSEFLKEEKPPAAAPAPQRTAVHAEPSPPARPAEPSRVEGRPLPSAPEPPPVAPRPPAGPLEQASRETRGAREAATREAVARETAAREAAARLTLGAEPERSSSGRGPWLALAAVALLAAVAGGAWYALGGRGGATATATPSSTLSPAALAAMARVQELEQKIQQLEREKAEAEAKAAEDARRNVEAQAASRGAKVDPAALARAQDEARERARREQEDRQREELRQLEEARTREQALATPPPEPAPVALPVTEPEPQQAAEPAAPEPVTTTTTLAAEPPTPEPVRHGMLVQADEPGVVGPVLLKGPDARFPKRAWDLKMRGSVEVLATVDENGAVSDVRVTSVRPRGFEFEVEAARAARQRLYRPATKNGVPVSIRLPIVFNFEPKK